LGFGAAAACISSKQLSKVEKDRHSPKRDAPRAYSRGQAIVTKTKSGRDCVLLHLRSEEENDQTLEEINRVLKMRVAKLGKNLDFSS
jgi:hypothetical protein